MTSHLIATYELRPSPGESVEAKASDITLEQTVELPESVLSRHIKARVPGRILAITAVDEGCWRAEIEYPDIAPGTELLQTVNVLYGNISLKAGIRLVDVAWPDAMLAAFGGPGVGMTGLRELTGVRDRVLLATALKPVGLSARDLASHAALFAEGGIDLIKDDHGLANQPTAPFQERLTACQRAVERADGNALYLPNVTAGWPELVERTMAAAEAGCRAVLVNPLLSGLETMRWIRDHTGLAVLAHPSMSGVFFDAGHGIAPEILLGDLFRLAGADMVIYPNVGGRFGFDQALCDRLNHRLRAPLGTLRACAPVPAGGMDAARAPDWARRYGADTILLIGGSLYARGDLKQAARTLRDAVEAIA